MKENSILFWNIIGSLYFFLFPLYSVISRWLGFSNYFLSRLSTVTKDNTTAQLNVTTDNDRHFVPFPKLQPIVQKLHYFRKQHTLTLFTTVMFLRVERLNTIIYKTLYTLDTKLFTVCSQFGYFWLTLVKSNHHTLKKKQNNNLTFFNPLTPKISSVILLTVCHIFLLMLVWRI